MATHRRKDNTPAGRLMRQATAYARLARKSEIAGNWREAEAYTKKYIELRARALRMRQRRA